jgi:hypothetical protein
MVKFFVDFGPTQNKITEDKIREMISLKPRRMKISVEFTDRYGIKKPYKDGVDWAVWFPFIETFENAFEAMTSSSYSGMKLAKNGNCFAFLSGTTELTEPPSDIVKCCEVLGKYVVIRDCMALSFALDYDHINGCPTYPHSEVGKLRDLAKPRDGSQPTVENYKKGAMGLVKLCLVFLSEVTCYDEVNCVVAMPSSTPGKKFDLPRDLAKIISEQRNIENLSEHVKTIKQRDQLKEVVVGNRLDTIVGTIAVDAEVFKGKTVLLIDDVYQSGVSINYVAMLLQHAGASKIYGLACDKTCSNTDNVG